MNYTKKLSPHTFFMLLFLVSLFIACHKKGNDPVSEETLTNLISAPWRINKVTVDGVDQSTSFTGFTLAFTNNHSYTTTHGGLLWPATGEWSFKDETNKVLRRSDDVEIELIEITPTTLKMKMLWSVSGLGYGRTNSIQGQYLFEMTR
jgi:hypothetical protein